MWRIPRLKPTSCGPSRAPSARPFRLRRLPRRTIEIASFRGAVTHTKDGLHLGRSSSRILEGCSNLPKRAPDLENAVCFPERSRIFDPLAPSADILERDRARVAVTENRLDPFPSPPPVLARALFLAGPLLGSLALRLGGIEFAAH